MPKALAHQLPLMYHSETDVLIDNGVNEFYVLTTFCCPVIQTTPVAIVIVWISGIKQNTLIW